MKVKYMIALHTPFLMCDGPPGTRNVSLLKGFLVIILDCKPLYARDMFDALS